MVMEDPIAPVLGVRLVMPGFPLTAKFALALDCPPTVTVTGALPIARPVGTGAVMLVADQVEGVVAVPLNFTVLPLKGPKRKLVPAITIEELIAPTLGVRLEIVGTPVAKGKVTWESKLPFRVPSISNSPLKVLDDVPVRLTPTHK
jgi:hypothetical protein